MLAQQLLDFTGIDVLAAALEHVVGPADEEHEAVVVAAHDVAVSYQPSIRRFFVSVSRLR